MSRDGKQANLDTTNLPALPEGWCWASTGDLFSFVTSGSRGWAKHYSDDGAIFLRVGNLDHASVSLDLTNIQRVSVPSGPEALRTRIQSGDLLISVTADVGMVGLVPESIGEAYVNQHVAIARPKAGVFGQYLAWYLASQHGGQHQFSTLQRGATKAGLGLDDVRAVTVPMAPDNEQRRIVAKIEELFSDLDAGVAALQRAKAKLKRYRAAVLKAAVEGRLTEQWRAEHPPKETAADLLKRILKQRRCKWEQEQLAAYEKAGKKPPANWQQKYKEPAGPDDTNLPALPEGWCWATVEQLLVEDSCNGISVKGSNLPPGVPALRLSAMGDSGFNYADRRYIPISREVADALAIEDGDFFVSRGNGSLHLVGRGTLAQPPSEQIVFPDTMIRLRFSHPIGIRKYLAAIWPSRLLRRQIEKKARTTAGIYKISQRDIDGFVVPLPPLVEQERIIAEIERGFSLAEEADTQTAANLKRSSRLRQAILKRAFEGKLVPQDPNDEPASVLLDRIKRGQLPDSPLARNARTGQNSSRRCPRTRQTRRAAQ